MRQKKFSTKIRTNRSFPVVAELTPGPNFNFKPIEKFLTQYKNAQKSAIPSAFDFTAVTSTQNPSGVANIEPADVLSLVNSKKLLASLDFIPHVTCKDQNTDAILASLDGFRKNGIQTILALTGDKPTKAKPVFELDSIGLLRLIKKINLNAYVKAKPDSIQNIRQFFPGAAVSPFKYTEPSLLQQYYKMEKKITSGAEFFITQLGWDWKKSLELFTYIQKNKLQVPVIGNVYLLSTTNPAPRLMHDIKLTGCFVSDQLLEKLHSENLEQHIDRAAQQVAMYKDLGAAGVDIAGIQDFNIFTQILKKADQIGKDWQKYKDNLHWPPENAFYLYDSNAKQRPLSKTRKTLNQLSFNFFHRAILDPDYRGFHALKKTMSRLGAKNQQGKVYKTFNALEKAFKYLAFECEECGDCYLPENFSLCTIGGCEKGMNNAPCGDATVEGLCGNNLDRVCIGEKIYLAAAAEKNGLNKLRKTINKPRNPQLEHTASILNYLFAKDHTKKNLIISIGESVHASIPKTGKIMKQLAELPNPYTKQSPQLNYIKALIESQALDGADYIAVNLDAFGETKPQLAVQMIKQYVNLVRKYAPGIPVCIDSSNDDVLIAGLKEWYNTAKPVRKPLINSVKTYTMDRILPLKKDYDFNFVGLLVTEEKPTGPEGSHSVDELFQLAKKIYHTAVTKYDFKPHEIFFDSTVFPLAIDMPMEPGVPGYTYRAFETIRKIKNDPQLKHAHCSLGVSNAVRDLPGRKIGVCRAYVAKAIEYGLDAGIVNTAHQYGSVEPDPRLMQLVNAFAKMDGSQQKQSNSMKLMAEFCKKNRKPPK